MKQYYGLRGISVVYKALMLITVLCTLGALGFISAEAFGKQSFLEWLPQALTLTVGGGLLALTLYVVAQVIDIQIEQNINLRAIEERLSKSPDSSAQLKALTQSVDALRQDMQTAVQQMNLANRASRLQTPPHAAPTQAVSSTGSQPPP